MPRSRSAISLRSALPLLAAVPVVAFALYLLPAGAQPEPAREQPRELEQAPHPDSEAAQGMTPEQVVSNYTLFEESANHQLHFEESR